MTQDQDAGLTRRDVMVAGLAGVATMAGMTVTQDAGAKTAGKPGARLPVVFLPHGGGPWPFVDLGMDPRELDALAVYLRDLKDVPKGAPKALLVISAHWEEDVPTVMTGVQPPMLFDYYGFPPESYRLRWPAPGNPQLAVRVQELLGAAGIKSAQDAQRGFDHGTFVPLMLTYPEAAVPTVQLSLKTGLDPAEHLALGRALAPLRDEGVFILGSGMSFHNLRSFGDPRSGPVSQAFDAWLGESVVLERAARDQRLVQWSLAPSARQCHPREEHLLPLMVMAGAAGEDRGRVTYRGTMMGAQLSAVQFG